MTFQFGNVVVVDGGQIGVIVKSWDKDESVFTDNGKTYDVYVRNLNGFREYREEDIRRFIYSKDLTDEEKEFYEA
jgi:hypothetical protein